jgi:hypothetical protein
MEPFAPIRISLEVKDQTILLARNDFDDTVFSEQYDMTLIDRHRLKPRWLDHFQLTWFTPVYNFNQYVQLTFSRGVRRDGYSIEESRGEELHRTSPIL